MRQEHNNNNNDDDDDERLNKYGLLRGDQRGAKEALVPLKESAVLPSQAKPHYPIRHKFEDNDMHLGPCQSSKATELPL